MTSASEALFQECVFEFCRERNHRLIVPNSQVLGRESDVVSVTTADMLVEFEIKISRADFQRDRKKARHLHLKAKLDANDPWLGVAFNYTPAYFYYVVPINMIRESEVAHYAGLIEISIDERAVFVTKRAPRLHDGKVSDRQRRWLERSLTQRYWRVRLGKREL
jgi:hypothetical protein